MSNGWEQLQCAFFAKICIEELGSYLESEGFTKSEENQIGGIVFHKWGVFIEVSYEPETAPKYSPRLIIGTGDAPYDPNLSPTGVPFWYILPSSSEERKYSFWKFDDESALRRVLHRIKDSILDSYGRELWGDRDQLERISQNFKDEFYV